MDNEKSEIFLSFFSEEIRPARLLKHNIEKAFSYEFKVFMSPENIQHGQDWFQEIGKALKQCKIIILFCSPISVKKEWMHFEAGCAYSLGIPIITICHSDLNVKDLPSNLTRFHNAEITEDIEVLKKIFEDIQKILKYKKQLSINYQEVLDEMNDEKNNITQEYKRISKIFASVLKKLKNPCKLQVQKEFNKKYLKDLNIEVETAKSHLKELGYYSGKIDNQVTPSFINSIINYQSQNSVEPVDGLLGIITYDSILGAIASKDR